MPPRTVWTGSLSFGLVNVPVGLYPATTDKSVHFNQFEEGTTDRIRYRKVNERTGEEVPGHRIVRGVDVGGGEYVMVTDEELEASEPERSHDVEVIGFVDLDDIDPMYFRSSYYMAPTPKGPDKAYALLRTAMQRSGKVAIATLIMRNKEYQVAIRPSGDGLVLETLYFADEIREPGHDLPALPDASVVSDRELEVADLLIDAMAMEWDPTEFHDTHRQALMDLIERKRDGETIVTGDLAPKAPVVDLMAALEASMQSTGQGRQRAAARMERSGVTTVRVPTPDESDRSESEDAAPKAATPKRSAKRATGRSTPPTKPAAAKPAATKPSTSRTTTAKKSAPAKTAAAKSVPAKGSSAAGKPAGDPAGDQAPAKARTAPAKARTTKKTSAKSLRRAS